MRAFLILLVTAAAVQAAVCKGDDPCRACVDCSKCVYCSPKNPRHGSCGTLRAQTAKEEAARQKKQGTPRPR